MELQQSDVGLGPIQIVVAVRNRPIYLWNCLDAIYRFTQTPHDVLLVDMASDDPMVARVSASFERRGLLSDVKVMSRNDPRLLEAFVFERMADLSPYFVYIEADAVLLDSGRCWLSQMADAMDRDAQLAMLGSAIDQRDFVDLERARALSPDLDEPSLRALIKADSPERLQSLESAEGKDIFYPHNPAGRLMMLRTEALRQVGGGTDGHLDHKFRQAGFSTGIMTGVRHRHMSLLHIFDEPLYDYGVRNSYMNTLDDPE